MNDARLEQLLTTVPAARELFVLSQSHADLIRAK